MPRNEQSARETIHITPSTLLVSEEKRRELIPPLVYQLASHPENVRAVISEGKLNSAQTAEQLQLLVVEKDYSVPLTNPADWQRWMEARQATISGSGIQLASRGPGINRLHIQFRPQIEDGIITINDRVLFSVLLRKDLALPAVLEVSYFDSEKNRGIGTQFYQEQLPQFARSLGFRFIVGSNNQKNIDFFTGKLGRRPLSAIKPEKRAQLFSKLEANSNLDLYTVQFLYPADEAEFCLT
jgi:hypothetical protein